MGVGLFRDVDGKAITFIRSFGPEDRGVPGVILSRRNGSYCAGECGIAVLEWTMRAEAPVAQYGAALA